MVLKIYAVWVAEGRLGTNKGPSMNQACQTTMSQLGSQYL